MIPQTSASQTRWAHDGLHTAEVVLEPKYKRKTLTLTDT